MKTSQYPTTANYFSMTGNPEDEEENIFLDYQDFLLTQLIYNDEYVQPSQIESGFDLYSFLIWQGWKSYDQVIGDLLKKSQPRKEEQR